MGSSFLTPVLKHKPEHVTSMLNALQLSSHCLQGSELWQYGCSLPHRLPLAFLPIPGDSSDTHVCMFSSSLPLVFSRTAHSFPQSKLPHLIGLENSFTQPEVQKFPSLLTFLEIPPPIS